MDSGYTRGGYDNNSGGGSGYSRGRGGGRGNYRGRGGYRGGRGGGDGNYGGSPNYSQMPPSSNTPYQTTRFKAEDMVAVKIRGLPYQVRYTEIGDFFRQFRYIEKSAVLGVGADGRKNGYGAILFESNEEATNASEELDQANIGTRYVELSVISYGDYLAFNGP